MRGSVRLGAYALVLAVGAGCWSSAIAQDTVTPVGDYSHYLTAAQHITSNPTFGEQISLRDGALSFRNTDVEIPGTGPTIRITRSVNISGKHRTREDTSGSRFGEWQLELPRLTTLVSTNTKVFTGTPIGWQIGSDGDSAVPATNARCTNFNQIGGIYLKTNDNTNPVYDDGDWWAGYQLVEDQGQTEAVLQTSGTAGPISYVARTQSNWMIGCLATTSNGQPGEAFQAIAPDGTKYWLDYLATQPADILNPDNVPHELGRQYASMLVTRVQDRFGNWVTYHYTSGMVDSIDASDGRHVGLTYSNGSISTVTAGTGSAARSWQYQYATTTLPSGLSVSTLTSVIQPDGSTWTYNFGGISSLTPFEDNNAGSAGSGNCMGPPSHDGIGPALASGSLTTPAGATATYSVAELHVARSYVLKACYSIAGSYTLYAQIPADSWSYAILSKSISGAGLQQATWNYNYSPGNGSWSSDCASGCVSSVWTDVTDPDGTRHRSIFSNKADQTENKLLRQETYAPGSPGVLMRSVDYTYATASGGGTNPYPWPQYLGTDFNGRSNREVTTRWTPIKSTVIKQGGVAFSRSVNSYDARARPTSVTKSSAPSP